MIAHSFSGAVFGPAQKLTARHISSTSSSGAPTSTPTASSSTSGRATEVLKRILGDLNFRNLDDEPAFKGRNTTTEFLARVVFDRMASAIQRGDLGAGALAVELIKVTLHESHIAWASFEGRVSLQPR